MAIPAVQPIRLAGRWRDGYALDYHTVGSAYVGDDGFGRPLFETTRTELGELLFRLKFRGDERTVAPLAQAAASFVAEWNAGIDAIVPVPPSRMRPRQPVLLLAAELAARVGVPALADAVDRVRENRELKNVYDYAERTRLLQGIHAVDREAVAGRRVLLFDDLYRSGATMNSVAQALYDEGGAAEVFALTLTRTRSHK